jgi:hypothetical protein
LSHSINTRAFWLISAAIACFGFDGARVTHVLVIFSWCAFVSPFVALAVAWMRR